MLTSYETLESMVATSARAVRPKERLSVSEAAEKYRKLNNPGSYVGNWDNGIAPYLVEPMDVLGSREYTGMIFAGPARTGKSDMFFNWLCSTAITDPADMMLVHMTQATARDWSQGDLARAIRHSPDLGATLVPGRANDNVHDKRFLSGMRLLIKWPTITELSGKTVPRQWIMDYDRMAQDIDGEGTPFDLTRKRGTTFGRRAMCAAESSPGFEVTNPKWIAKSPHEAPPTKGILALYNRGDRRRYQWCCVDCGGKFEPTFSLLKYPDSADMIEASEMVTLDCPYCGYSLTHEPGPGQPGRAELNRSGRWVKDGMRWLQNGEISGKPFRSDIASFWLKGPHATFMPWSSLVLNYLKAVDDYERTGSQEALKATVTVDQGEAFVARGEVNDRLPEELKSRARDYGQRLVPQGGRFLVAAVDVQKNRFDVQVHAIGYGEDTWVVDRFAIKRSEREDPEAPGQFLWVNPGAYFEDWHLITKQVLTKSYKLDDDSGREMAIKLTLCDSAGREGVTANAYNYWRFLRDGPEDYETDEHGRGTLHNTGWQPGLTGRFLLLKGSPLRSAPRVAIGYPDSERKDRHAGARGEVPILFINTDLIKDTVDKRLDRKDAGGGRINFPNWLPDNFYTELTVEYRDPNKGWLNPKNFRNESWDLLCYAHAACLSRSINIERPGFWEEPPSWAEEWDSNDLVFNPVSGNKPFENTKKPAYDLAQLAQELA